MSILTDDLPQTVTVSGKEYTINADFRVGIKIEQLMLRADLPDDEKLMAILELFYPVIPADIEGALNALLSFWSLGRAESTDTKGEQQEKPRERKNERLYDFEQDAAMIYAAFLSVYGIDLSNASLHWWIFRGLMDALPENCAFCKVMGYRSITPEDTKNMSKRQKDFYAKMKKQYRLKQADEKLPQTLKERNRQMLEYVDKLFSEQMDRHGGERD